MYEIHRHKKDIEALIHRLKEDSEKGTLEGVVVVRVHNKNQETEVDAVFGSVSQFEWVGIMDYVIDVIKMVQIEEI